MNKTKSIRKNYIYNLTYQILQLITPLITTPYLARVLEADGVGIYSFADSIIQYFTLFTGMGISIYGQREVSYFQDNRKERSRVFWELKLLAAINASISVSIYLVMAFMNAQTHRTLYFLMSARIINVGLDATWFFAGMEEFGKIVVRNIIIKVLDIAFIFIFIKHKTDLTLHVAGALFFMIAGNLSLWGYLPEYVDKPDVKALRPYRDIKIIWSLFIPTIAVQIYTILDRTMLGMLTQGSAENGYYEQALRVTRLTLMLVTSLGSVIVPRIGYLFSKNEHDKINLYMYRSFRFVLFLSIPTCLGLAAISENFVPWFFGAGYEKVTGLLKVSSILFIAIGMNNITGVQYLIPTKRQNIYTFTVISGAAINFVLNIFLIRAYMSYGAIWASVVAESFIAVSQMYILRQELSIKTVIFSSKNYYISGFIMLSVLLFMNKSLAPSPLNTFIMILTGLCVYSAMVLILRDDFFIWNLKRAYNSLSQK